MKNIGTVILKTERLTLRRLQEEDIGVLRSFGCLSGSADEVEKRGQRMIKEYREPFCFHWVIELEAIPIGRIRAWDVDPFNDRCQLGYDIAEAYRKRGFMTEAVMAVIRYLFEEADFHRIFCHVRVGNYASARVCEKCGMVREGILKEHYKSQTGFDDINVYAIVKS